MNKRKPLVMVLLKETVVMGGVRYCFLNNDRGRRLLADMRMESAIRRINPIRPLKIEAAK